jgi:hypothetical protein
MAIPTGAWPSYAGRAPEPPLFHIVKNIQNTFIRL